MQRLFTPLRSSTTFVLALGLSGLGLSGAAAPAIWSQALLNTSSPALPNAPSTVLLSLAEDDRSKYSEEQRSRHNPNGLPPCPSPTVISSPEAAASASAPPKFPCYSENPLRSVVNSEQHQPLSIRQKGHLAVRNVIDPFNLIVIVGEAGVSIAANSHSAFGPGFEGFGRLTGYQLLQAGQGEFFGTFLIPSLVHEDPRYRRMQNASVKRRIVHALARTLIAQHDDGRYMPNYATLLTYPISAELSNLYVPGINSNGPSTIRRIAIGLATDPAGNLIAEFLPDIARRIHVRSIFIQQIVNSMSLSENLGQ